MRIDYPRRAYSGVRRFVPSWRQWLSLAVVGVVVATSGFVALYLAVDIPAPNELSQAQTSVVYYDNGKTEIGQFAEVNRTIVPLSEVPVYVQHAVLAAEDRGFYDNQGISPTSILRAAWNNLTGGGTQGASTITQQYARNVYLTQERTWKRKIKEAILAIKLDRELSKDQILEDYLNTIYFGRGAYGIEAASEAYFRKDVSDLTVAEGAVLASVIQSPTAYDPASGKAAQQALADRVLNYVIPGMVDQGWLDDTEAAKISMPKIRPPQQGNQFRGQRGYLLFYVRNELRRLGFSETEIDTGGLRVTTTFNQDAMTAAKNAVEDGFPTVNAKGVQAGLASVEPGTGRIVAMYGGRNYLARQLDNATVRQQPGSAFKAFTLAAALKAGVTLTDTFAGNSPYYIPGVADPVNNEFDQSYGDQVSLLTATEQSINTAFVDMSVQIGPEKVLDAVVAAGIPKDAPGLTASPALTLGTASASPLQMATAYATFAAEGQYAPAYSVQEVQSPSGEVLYKAQPQPKQAF
ncbi:MAG TPA: transglycosylase domain-containing protein, partial [Actinomycetes bacterium]|nr:transglycosylase domain-containing protein [Actinomycetes bacterium]